jgi:hypothetical protein
MGDGLYTPYNIQRPGFGYKRRSDDDVTPPGWGTDADTGYANTPSPSPSVPGYSWQDAQNMRGSAGDPTVTQQNAEASAGGTVGMPTEDPNAWMRNDLMPEPPVPGASPQTSNQLVATVRGAPASPPSGPSIPPPVAQQPAPYTPGPEQQRLKQMERAGPRRSILGTIAAMGAGAAAGYVNAARRTSVPVPTQAMQDLTWRAPKGVDEQGNPLPRGSWNQALGRQKALAAQEELEQKEKQSAQQIQAQAAERMATVQRDIEQGQYWKQTAATAAKKEEDQARENDYNRLVHRGSRGQPAEVISIPPGAAAPPGDGWYIAPNDPMNPGNRLAVRPYPGHEISAEQGKAMGIMPETSTGKYYATPQMIDAYNNTQTKGYLGELAATKAQLKMEQDARTRGAELDERKYRDKLLALQFQQLQGEKQGKNSAAAESGKAAQLNQAETLADAERNKIRQSQGVVSAEDEARIAKTLQARRQMAYNNYSSLVRQYGGAAFDVRVDEHGNPIQTTNGYLKGQQPTYLEGEGPQPTTPKPTTPATSTPPATPATTSKVPPPPRAPATSPNTAATTPGGRYQPGQIVKLKSGDIVQITGTNPQGGYTYGPAPQ